MLLQPKIFKNFSKIKQTSSNKKQNFKNLELVNKNCKYNQNKKNRESSWNLIIHTMIPRHQKKIIESGLQIIFLSDIQHIYIKQLEKMVPVFGVI